MRPQGDGTDDAAGGSRRPDEDQPFELCFFDDWQEIFRQIAVAHAGQNDALYAPFHRRFDDSTGYADMAVQNPDRRQVVF